MFLVLFSYLLRLVVRYLTTTVQLYGWPSFSIFKEGDKPIFK